MNKALVHVIVQETIKQLHVKDEDKNKEGNLSVAEVAESVSNKIQGKIHLMGKPGRSNRWAKTKERIDGQRQKLSMGEPRKTYRWESMEELIDGKPLRNRSMGFWKV